MSALYPPSFISQSSRQPGHTCYFWRQIGPQPGAAAQGHTIHQSSSDPDDFGRTSLRRAVKSCVGVQWAGTVA